MLNSIASAPEQLAEVTSVKVTVIYGATPVDPAVVTAVAAQSVNPKTSVTGIADLDAVKTSMAPDIIYIVFLVEALLSWPPVGKVTLNFIISGVTPTATQELTTSGEEMPNTVENVPASDESTSASVVIKTLLVTTESPLGPRPAPSIVIVNSSPDAIVQPFNVTVNTCGLFASIAVVKAVHVPVAPDVSAAVTTPSPTKIPAASGVIVIV